MRVSSGGCDVSEYRTPEREYNYELHTCTPGRSVTQGKETVDVLVESMQTEIVEVGILAFILCLINSRVCLYIQLEVELLSAKAGYRSAQHELRKEAARQSVFLICDN